MDESMNLRLGVGVQGLGGSRIRGFRIMELVICGNKDLGGACSSAGEDSMFNASLAASPFETMWPTAFMD